MTLRAGAATVDITPPVGVMMDGYGGRTTPSQAVRDPLFARVLVLDDGDSACAIVGTDLLGTHERITGEVRERVAAATSITPDAVLVSATHSHAGPVGLRGGMFSMYDEALAAGVIEKITAAIVHSFESRQTATLATGAATLNTVSQNRRDPDWPIDPVMRVLLVEGEDGPLATLINFACHATVMTGANLEFSAEFPGAACRIVQEQTGAPCVYVNGACGNVNPTWIKQDYENVLRVGQIVGGQALRTIGELRTVGPGQRAHNIRWDEFPEKPVPGRVVEPKIKAARRELEVPLRLFADDEAYANEVKELGAKAAALPEGSHERREVAAQLSRAQNERWAAAWARRQDAPTSQATEVQAIGLGDGLAIVALPGEFFVETGEAIREAWSGDLIVACYANGYIGYVIPEDAYAQGGYESGVTFCTQGAEELIRSEAIQLLKELG